MKFASLLIDMNFIGQAEEQSTQRKKINRYAIFFTINARRACFLLFSGVPVPFCGVNENNKINNLSVLCDSNERSEWAVKNKENCQCLSKFFAPPTFILA
jgi:hypothetical protein